MGSSIGSKKNKLDGAKPVPYTPESPALGFPIDMGGNGSGQSSLGLDKLVRRAAPPPPPAPPPAAAPAPARTVAPAPGGQSLGNARGPLYVVIRARGPEGEILESDVIEFPEGSQILGVERTAL